MLSLLCSYVRGTHSMVAAEVVSLDSPDLRTVLMIQDEVDEVRVRGRGRVRAQAG